MSVVRTKPFFYSSEIKRVIVQLMGVFAGYQVVTGTQRDGQHRHLSVPMIYGNVSRLAHYVMSGGSEITYQTVPIGTLTRGILRQNPERRHSPYHSEKFSYIEKAIDENGRIIVGVPGKSMTVERFMPVPHVQPFDIEFWTSNEDQQFQLIEQITGVFNPTMEFKMSDSPADWSAISNITFDGTFDTGEATPNGHDGDPFYTLKMTFEAEVWLGVPAKVYETNYIQTIQVPFHDLTSDFNFDESVEMDRLIIRADDEDILRVGLIPENGS